MSDVGEQQQAAVEDPRVTNLYRRMRQLVLLSLVVMGLGFVVVFAAIVYRLSLRESGEQAVEMIGLGLPAGTRLVSVTAADGRLLLVTDSNGQTRVHVLDGESLREHGRIELGSTPAPASVPLPGSAPAAR
jgi:hypothetical protein